MRIAHQLVRAYRGLPEPIRYSLRPLNGLTELASFLPPAPRAACQDGAAAVRSLTTALRRRSELVVLEGESRLDRAPLRVLTDLGGEAASYWTTLLLGRFSRRTVGEIRGVFGFAHAAPPDMDADVVLLRHHRVARSLARRRGFVSVPTWVQAFVDTRRPIDAIVRARGSGRKGRKNDVRRARRGGLAPRLERGSREVRTFLHDWYLPYARGRWGESFATLGGDWMRQAERFCWVLWVVRGDERVAGMLVEPQGDTLRSIALGLRDEHERNDAFAALQYFLLEHAAARGWRRVRMGGSRPVLSDAPLAFKLKWGGVIEPVRQWDYLAFWADGGSPAAALWLSAHAPIAEIDGRYFAITGAGARRAADPRPRPEYGLAGVVRASRAGFDVRRWAAGSQVAEDDGALRSPTP